MLRNASVSRHVIARRAVHAMAVVLCQVKISRVERSVQLECWAFACANSQMPVKENSNDSFLKEDLPEKTPMKTPVLIVLIPYLIGKKSKEELRQPLQSRVKYNVHINKYALFQ